MQLKDQADHIALLSLMIVGQLTKRLIEIAKETGADAIAHGATGKGNDQVRFELSYYALNPDIKVIAPWREWAFKSRSDLIAFAEKHQIQVAKDIVGSSAPYLQENMTVKLSLHDLNPVTRCILWR